MQCSTAQHVTFAAGIKHRVATDYGCSWTLVYEAIKACKEGNIRNEWFNLNADKWPSGHHSIFFYLDTILKASVHRPALGLVVDPKFDLGDQFDAKFVPKTRPSGDSNTWIADEAAEAASRQPFEKYAV